jgi:hypothetical protein
MQPNTTVGLRQLETEGEQLVMSMMSMHHVTVTDT